MVPDFISPEWQKRETGRLIVDIHGSFRFVGKEDWIPAHIIDISKGGLYFEGQSSFYVGDILDIKIPLENRNIIAKLEVTSISGKKAGGKFVSIMEKDQEFIREFINKAFRERKF